ncbi:MAG: putative two-component system response regulatory protein [Bacteroidetes bacterium]|nr:putative two-component system response regulatory protein [Bacteroidota bacterium]
MTSDHIHILLADDSPDEHFLFIHTVKGIDKNVTVSTVANGEELIARLEKTTAALPDLIFLDINMPLKNGKESLADIRQNEKLKDLPVIIYSTSDEKKDIEETYALGANLYIKKPQDFIELEDILAVVIKRYRAEGIKRMDRSNYIFA